MFVFVVDVLVVVEDLFDVFGVIDDVVFDFVGLVFFDGGVDGVVGVVVIFGVDDFLEVDEFF